MEFIDYITSSINIYNSLIIYDNKSYDIESFTYNMYNKDYPIGYFDENIPIDVLENKYRMILLPYDKFLDYLFYKNNDLTNITVIFCLHKYNYIINKLSIHKPKIEEDINVFQV